jgi:hypothetical protein
MKLSRENVAARIILQLFTSMLDLEPTLIQSHPYYQTLLN